MSIAGVKFKMLGVKGFCVIFFLTASFLVSNTATQAVANFLNGKDAYENGDYRRAFLEWEGLALNGDSKAQAALGSLYLSGKGVDTNYELALKWTRLAADQGDITGEFNLGNMYAKGFGVSQDYSEAVRWFQKAAEKNDAMSRYNLALLYSRGLGVERNDEEALYMLYTAAIIAGTPELNLAPLAKTAETIAMTLMMTMADSEIDSAFKRSKNFERRYVEGYLKIYMDRKGSVGGS